MTGAPPRYVDVGTDPSPQRPNRPHDPCRADGPRHPGTAGFGRRPVPGSGAVAADRADRLHQDQDRQHGKQYGEHSGTHFPHLGMSSASPKAGPSQFNTLVTCKDTQVRTMSAAPLSATGIGRRA
ncbi:hypothetical protein NUM_64320 [Actinocatenispora comari]|uniref:Uncharacterized protein n=1 Tax=Actinocatenispora comari TaxID=2807577 RepID=A0A8J4EPU7_9ACTN|nr:hypothetical protein NUM_64320 [Actinocatenispora comari]